MILVGISWLVFWLMVEVFEVAFDKAALVTGLIFVLVGLVLERPWVRR